MIALLIMSILVAVMCTLGYAQAEAELRKARDEITELRWKLANQNHPALRSKQWDND